MELIIRKTTQDAVKLVATIITDAVIEKPNITLGLATGGTMEKLYDKIALMHKEEKIDFSLVKSFNLDEYIGLEPTDKNSYRFYMNHHLFDKINIDKRNTHIPSGVNEDTLEEGEIYEALIEEAGGLDIQLLGIGLTGHIGFNEPLSSFASRTRAKTLAPTTLAQNGPYFGSAEKTPKRAMTMGVGTILDAGMVIMLATGASKADIIAKTVEGPITPMISASALHFHPNCIIVCDEAAAEKLQNKDYYNSIFETDPKWEPYRNI